MKSVRGQKIACANCGNIRAVVSRGLCYKCHADKAVRASAEFRGRILKEEELCLNCKKRAGLKGRRGLCIECHRTPLVREQFSKDATRKAVLKKLTAEQQAEIAKHYRILRGYVFNTCRRWGILLSDRDELFSAAMEIVCRRASKLDMGKNPKSFLLNAAMYGMRWGLKWGPFKRPNTVYLADQDTDGHELISTERSGQ